MKAKLAIVAAFALLVFVRCDTVYDIDLTLTDGAVGRGFACQTDAGSLIGNLKSSSLTVVLDVIDTGNDVLSCRPNTILDHCAQGSCFVLKRACYPVNIDAGLDLATDVQEAYAQLKADDAGIANIPTARTVMIRFVVTAQSLSPACLPSEQLTKADLGGCVYSCPARLNASGTLNLDLDTYFGAACDTVVGVCATFEARDRLDQRRPRRRISSIKCERSMSASRAAFAMLPPARSRTCGT